MGFKYSTKARSPVKQSEGGRKAIELVAEKRRRSKSNKEFRQVSIDEREEMVMKCVAGKKL